MNVPNRASIEITASGAITPTGEGGLYHITKAGVAALTLPSGDDLTVDGMEIEFHSETAHAHTITIPPPSPATYGMNGGAVSVATFAAAKGSTITFVSRAGSWWVKALNGVTLS